MTGGRWHLLGAGLVGLVLLGAATVVDGWLPSDREDPGSDPFVRVAEVGDSVDLRTMSVQVDTVQGTRTLLEYGSELRSPGVWVVVEYTVVATDENTAVGFAELRDGDDRVWSLSGRNQNTCPAGPPGLPVSCVAYFEVPADALRTLRLRLARDALEQRYDAVVEVDLALTDQDAAGFAAASPLELPDTTIGGRS